MWQGILGHDDVVEQFRRTLTGGRLASTYLFVGPPGIGKRRFALALAKSLLCSESNDSALAPCGQCESCRLFAAGNHPDLDVVALPRDKSQLPIALFIGDKDHRHQEGLCHRISLKPFLGRRKIAIIDDADHFNEESANCLLKTLEEPPPDSLLILLGTSPSRQLPTIRSRSQVVRFQPLSAELLRQILLDEQLAANIQPTELAAISEGSVERAVELAAPELWEFRAALLDRLAHQRWNAVETGTWITEFVQAAGTESAARRDRLRLVVGFAIDYYRGQMRSAASELVTKQADSTFESAIPLSRRSLEHLEASLAALEQVDRNANLALVVSCWVSSLARSA